MHLSSKARGKPSPSPSSVYLPAADGCLNKCDSSCRSRVRGDVVRSLLRPIYYLCCNSHQTRPSVQPSNLGCKLPPIYDIYGSLCVDVQPLLSCTRICSVFRVRKRNSCTIRSKFDDFCGRLHWRLAPDLSMLAYMGEAVLCDCSPPAHCSWGLWVHLAHPIPLIVDQPDITSSPNSDCTIDHCRIRIASLHEHHGYWAHRWSPLVHLSHSYRR